MIGSAGLPLQPYDRQPAGPRPHVVQFYADELSLLTETVNHVEAALVLGESVLVVATDRHRRALARQLAHDLNFAKTLAEGRYAELDAAEAASSISLNGMPDSALFNELIGNVITRAAAASKSNPPRVTIFGEMVALLWAEGKYQAAILLEQLWNELAAKYSFSLRCAYPMDGFHSHQHAELFATICAGHSAVVPEGASSRSLSPDHSSRAIATLQQKVRSLENEHALRESEHQFRSLVEAVQDYAIFTLDPGGRVTSWNVGAERMKGYPSSEILGQHFSRFYSPGDLRDGKPARLLDTAIRTGRAEDEGWRLRKDGSQFWANVVITSVKDDHGELLGFTKVTRDFTERMLAQRALEESQERLRESESSLRALSLHLLRTQDEERRQIGRDLHDSLGQYLSVLKMKIDSLALAALRKGTDGSAELEQCSQLTGEAVKEVRTISYLLYPPMLEEMGLKTAIPWYLDGFSQRSGVSANFQASADFGRLERDVELALFRVLQESLTNVHRHSGSPTADVRLSMDDQEIALEIADQGKGMYDTASKVAPSPSRDPAGCDWMGSLGVGLRGMTERMKQIGGRLETSSSGKGTTVRAVVPRRAATATAC